MTVLICDVTVVTGCVICLHCNTMLAVHIKEHCYHGNQYIYLSSYINIINMHTGEYGYFTKNHFLSSRQLNIIPGI